MIGRLVVIPVKMFKSELRGLDANDWIKMTEETFSRVFKKSAVKRTKYAGLKRNIDFLKK
jgi:epoxyqueuosine reductase